MNLGGRKKLIKESKYFIYKKFRYIASEYQKDDLYYEKKILEIKVNNARVKEVTFLSFKNNELEKN